VQTNLMSVRGWRSELKRDMVRLQTVRILGMDDCLYSAASGVYLSLITFTTRNLTMLLSIIGEDVDKEAGCWARDYRTRVLHTLLRLEALNNEGSWGGS